MKNIYALAIGLCITFATEEKSFKHEKQISDVLQTYMAEVDNKNPAGMLEHLTMPFDIHFGSERTVTIRSDEEFRAVFENWKNQDIAQFHSTDLVSVIINQTGPLKNFLAVADVTYNRLDQDGNILRTERVLYHFMRGDGYDLPIFKVVWSFFTRWIRKWKIYMISNIDIE